MRELQEIATAHRQIREYFQGDFFDAVSRDAAQYPLMVATLQPGSLGDGFVQVNIIITIADKYNLQEYRQINEIHSDCLSICNDIKITMQQYRWTEFADINFTLSADPFIQRSQDMTAGWSMNVSLNVFDDGNWCDLPLDNYDFENGTPIHSNDCQPALVVNSDFTFSREIPSGDTFSLDDVHIVVRDQNENILSDMYYPAAVDEVIDVTIDPCADASYIIRNSSGIMYQGDIPSGDSIDQFISDSVVSNSNDSYYQSVPAQNNLELPDVTFSVENSLETVVASVTIPSVQSSILTAPDGTVQIKKENDGTLANVTTPSGASTLYTVANNAMTVNNANAFSIHATDPLDIRIHNQNGNDITPSSVTYNGNQHYVTAVINTASFVPVGAKLMKTGQTTSYATGDDGATQRGRLTSFLVLASNNPFGNTNRFTNKTGGQTYANSVAYDWSTYDGSTVLAYYWGDQNYRNFANSCTANTASTFDGLTGWYLWNIIEATNVMNFSLFGNFMLNYPPFSTSRRYFFTSNSSSTIAIGIDTAGSAYTTGLSKTSTNQGVYCRVCTVNGTTIS